MGNGPRESWEWDKAKKDAKRRDQYRCQHCGVHQGKWKNVDLHVHHIKPVSKGGSNDLDNLTTLCNSCHSSLHRHYDDRDELPVRLLEEERATWGMPDSRVPLSNFGDSAQEIVDLLKSNGPMQLKDIIEEVGHSRSHVNKVLKTLQVGKYVCRVSRGVYAYITELEFYRLQSREKDEHGRTPVRVWNPGEQVEISEWSDRGDDDN